MSSLVGKHTQTVLTVCIWECYDCNFAEQSAVYSLCINALISYLIFHLDLICITAVNRLHWTSTVRS